ncbi:PHD/FYVE-zinc-finger like domain-containing protein [Poronia punctata]|nr:PHD/FYVE-zinc-finger like domain-containing protein [Poronia punctata]
MDSLESGQNASVNIQSVEDRGHEDDVIPYEVDGAPQMAADTGKPTPPDDGSTTDIIEADITINNISKSDPDVQSTDHSQSALEDHTMQDVQEPAVYEDPLAYREKGVVENISEDDIPPGRQYDIEVVLYPPSDPDSYQYIPRSKRILRVLDEVDTGEETFYEVEFTDGRIRDAPYEDVIYCKGGHAAIQAYDEMRSASRSAMVRDTSKRLRSEDEYEESGSDYGDTGKRRRTRTASGARQTRKSTRQSSRQTSAEIGRYGHDGSGSRTMSLAESDDEIGQTAMKTTRSSVPRTIRLTRSHNSTKQQSAVGADSDDELAQDDNRDKDDDDDDDYDAFPIIRSDVAPQPKNSRRKKRPLRPRGTATRITKTYDSDSSIEFEPARRSGRSNRNLRNMKDPEIDEYDVVEEKQASAPKHVAIKEVFQDLGADSTFRRMHSETCETCSSESSGSKNPLVYCQGCSFSYHKGCIGIRAVRDHRVTKVGHDNFVLQCKFCIQVYKKKDGRMPDHQRCQVCRKPGRSCAEFSSKQTPKQEEKARVDNGGQDPITPVNPRLVNNADNVLFRCTNCKRGYHFEHLPAMTAEVMDDQDVRDNRLEEYALAGWSCKDCVDTKHKIHTLVAWRPLDPAAYTQGQTAEDYTEDNMEYLVKWTGRSHHHDTWMPGAWVFGVAPGVMRQAFHKRESSLYPKMDKAAAIPEEWLLPDVLLNVKYGTSSKASTKAEDLKRIDEITSVFVKFQGLSYEEVVWDDPPLRDSGAAWEAFVAAYDEYLNGKYFVTVPDYKMRERIALYRSLDFGKHCELKKQPTQLKQGKLMEYQMEGVNFLLYNFHQQQNVILADEMGLGKTVQIVAFLSALTHSKPGCWPFLVVVPNSTCPNWRRELKQWAPDLRVVTYHGGKVAQDLAYRHELYPDGPKGGMKAHVVIMSYEAAGHAMSTFNGVKWVGLIVDEGQRLKNDETNLYKQLRDMKIPCRILLTGTPLQNNKRELFNLLQFIDSRRNAEELDAKYAELTKDNLPELHGLIRPYFLRRTKAQVLKFLPPMAQIIVPVTMTLLQQKLSKSIMARNPDLIKAIISRSRIKAGERKSMNNILSDLRQCLCHPFCFNGAIEDKAVDAEQMHRNLVEASPKLMLLELMLPKLKEKGHRVLIFSQFLHSLTIIEDFLSGMNMGYARIDGSLSALEKQKRIDAFNAPDSALFAMLLSTRAGGVGINLATADTVIIYDPDFNPHQDIQALSRAHRIGQKNKVLCFQLMTKDTVEEKIMQMGRKKMALDHALIESMDAKEEVGEDLESILKHGAAALFSDESQDKIVYDHASVNKLLDRSQMENTDTGDDDSAETQFSFARIWANDKGELDTNTGDAVDEIPPEASTSIWENILKEREAEHQRELAAQQKVYGRGARRQAGQIDYKTNRPREVGDSSGSEDDDELYIDPNDVENDDNDDSSEADLSADGLGTKAPKEIVSSDVPGYHVLQPVQPVPPAPPSRSITPKAPPKETPARRGRPRKYALQDPSSHPKPTPTPTSTAPLPPPMQAAQAPPIRFQPPKAKPPQQRRPSQVHLPPALLSQIAPPQGGVHYEMQTVYATPSMSPLLPPALPGNYEHGLPYNVRPTPPTQRTVVRASGTPSPALPPPGKAVRLPNGDITTSGWIGGGNPCALCIVPHSTANPCVDLNSELSLRLAIDRLRFSPESAASRACRTYFQSRLQIVGGRSK